MTKREEKMLKREQELAKIREEIKQREIAWGKNLQKYHNADCTDPHFKPINWNDNSLFTPDANHWTNLD